MGIIRIKVRYHECAEVDRIYDGIHAVIKPFFKRLFHFLWNAWVSVKEEVDGELVRGGSPMANADQQGMQAKMQPRKKYKKASSGGLGRLCQMEAASFDTHEIAPPYQEDADAQKEA